MYNLECTEEELKQLVILLDIANKATGLLHIKEVLSWANKLQDAFDNIDNVKSTLKDHLNGIS